MLQSTRESYDIPESTTSSTLTENDKKRKRLERNRESARECRRRKREYVESLRLQSSHLEAENLQLRIRLKSGVTSRLDPNKLEMTEQINKMLQEGASDAEIKKAVEELQEKYADYGRDRRSSIAFHLAQLRKCLVPTQTTRTILWLLSYAPDFLTLDGEEKPAPPGMSTDICALWSSLCKELYPSIEQRKTLVRLASGGTDGDDHGPFPVLQKTTEESNRLMDRLEALISNKHNSFDYEMHQLQGILTARQVLRHLLYALLSHVF